MRKDFGLDIILGATDEDLKLYQAPTFSSKWSTFSQIYKGPEKSYVPVGFSHLGGLMKMGEE
jgi:hypothetical protein